MPSQETPKFARQSADFHPSLWGNEFLTCPDFKENEQDNIKLLKLKYEIERMLFVYATEHFQKLDLIDVIQRLGISYHFESQIDEILEKIHEDQDDHDLIKDDLNFTSLRFRLLRQHGYKISSEVFNKFQDIDGSFKESLTTDVKGLLSLYEASHLRVHEENILDEALDFTTKHLESIATQTKTNVSIARQIRHALKRPLRKGVPRIEARFYIQAYQEDVLHNDVILTFAKMDFNILQKFHQKELSDIVRWWKNLDFTRKLPFARDRVVELYFGVLGFYFEPKYLLARRILTKVFVMATVIDDIYDVYGTIEELEQFTKAIERWNVNVADQLPEYMKYCYEALLDVFNELEKDIAFGENSYRSHYAKEFMKNLVKNYLIEARWCNQEYVPTMEEYMQVATITGGRVWVVAASLLGMREIATKEAFEWLFSEPRIDKAASIIARLINDKAGHKAEQERKHVASAVECHMKQHGVSEEETTKLLLIDIENAWKDINEEYLMATTIPMTLLDRVLNYARTFDFFYKDEDFITRSYFIKDHIASLLKDPIPLQGEKRPK